MDDQIRVIDWAWPHRGPAWIDTAFLVPHLILAGHTAHDAEMWAGQIPAYQQADDAAVTAFVTRPDHLLGQPGRTRLGRTAGLPRPSRRGRPRLAQPALGNLTHKWPPGAAAEIPEPLRSRFGGAGASLVRQDCAASGGPAVRCAAARAPPLHWPPLAGHERRRVAHRLGAAASLRANLRLGSSP